ncbi:MAG: hypothetical protein IJ099_06995 [Alphaproteobacteria bacterium]|nr:hypothetical protein [Alphaproteobacteria bacterium]
MATKRIKLKNATGDYLEPYTTNVPDASTSAKGIVQLEATPTASSTKALTSGGAKTALDNKLDKTGTAAKATADASGNNIVNTYATKTALSAVETTANTAKSIAEGRARAVSFESYSALVTALNGAANTDYKVGDNIFIQAKEVPDLWVYSVESTTSSYSYTTDDALISALETGAVQVGYYKIAAMETGKVDLTGYVPTSRKINNKALTGDITLSASDVGALAANGTAAKATADASGNVITTTYATKAEIITYEEMS